MQRLLGRLAAAIAAALLLTGLSVAPVDADTGVGAGGFLALGGHELDVGFEQILQSALDSQFVGVEVRVVRGRLVLEGYATPGVHTAVLAIVGEVLQNPVPVPVALGVVSPDLGVRLPFLDAGADLEIPDVGSLLRVLGVVDHLRIVQ